MTFLPPVLLIQSSPLNSCLSCVCTEWAPRIKGGQGSSHSIEQYSPAFLDNHSWFTQSFALCEKNKVETSLRDAVGKTGDR